MDTLEFEELDRYLLAQNDRIIHQVWFYTGIVSRKRSVKMYTKLKTFRDSWKIKNPTWCHMEWNKETCLTLMKTFFPEHLDMYKKYKWEIQRCDSIRYFILYRYGGLYADMDYYCNRPFDDVLKKYTGRMYFVQTPNHYGVSISNALMYSKRKQTFWKKVHLALENYKDSHSVFISKHIRVMCTTGPTFLNRIYSKFKRRYGLGMYPYEKFWPHGTGDIVTSLTKDPSLYALHVCKGSWRKGDSVFLNSIVRVWRLLVFIVCIMLIPLSVHIATRYVPKGVM